MAAANFDALLAACLSIDNQVTFFSANDIHNLVCVQQEPGDPLTVNPPLFSTPHPIRHRHLSRGM